MTDKVDFLSGLLSEGYAKLELIGEMRDLLDEQYHRVCLTVSDLRGELSAEIARVNAECHCPSVNVSDAAPSSVEKLDLPEDSITRDA